jgi:hypothetical protein
VDDHRGSEGAPVGNLFFAGGIAYDFQGYMNAPQ